MQESSTGSFCPSVLNPRLHGYLSFAGSLLETAAKSLHLSCGSELTRQGISLWPCLATTRQLGGHVVPARRRADGTISSSAHAEFGVWPLRIPITSRRDLRRFIVCAISRISTRPAWVLCRPSLTIARQSANLSKSSHFAVR